MFDFPLSSHFTSSRVYAGEGHVQKSDEGSLVNSQSLHFCAKDRIINKLAR